GALTLPGNRVGDMASLLKLARSAGPVGRIANPSYTDSSCFDRPETHCHVESPDDPGSAGRRPAPQRRRYDRAGMDRPGRDPETAPGVLAGGRSERSAVDAAVARSPRHRQDDAG